MNAYPLSFLFAMAPLAVAVTGEFLLYRSVRIVLFCIFGPLIAVICLGSLTHADWTPESIVSVGGALLCGGLTLLGLCDIRQFFWAFRALSVVIFAQLTAMAILASTVGLPAARANNAAIDWFFAALIGLPCLWFARKAKMPPTTRRMHAIIKRDSIPSLESWQQALRNWGFDLLLEGPYEISESPIYLGVHFCEVDTGFQFDVSPLSRLVQRNELDEMIARRFGPEFVAVNFRFGDELEETAALLVAAALTKMTDGELYSPEHEAWWDGDDAIEAAQDVVQPLELHTLFSSERIPTFDQWRQALSDAGIEMDSGAPNKLPKHSGFLPVVFNGTPAGFAFSLSPADFVVGGDRFPTSAAPPGVFQMTESANFRFAKGDAARAAAVAAAVFARISDGIVFNPQRGSFAAGDVAVQAAAEARDSDDCDND